MLKVQHPGVAEMMRADVSFMPYLLSMVEMIEPNHGLRAFTVPLCHCDDFIHHCDCYKYYSYY